MSDVDYPACLRELIESEIFGEGVSLALLEVAKTDRDRYHFATLLQLETETKARLRPLLYRHGVALTEVVPAEEIDGIVQGYLASSWEEFASGNKAVVENFLSRFREIAEAGPDEDKEILNSMIRHESAILRWFDMESRGERDGSLDSIIDELQYPLPA
jgi:hypothetical protein